MVRTAFFALACLGVALCLCTHMASFLPVEIPEGWEAIHLGIFVVWGAAAFVLRGRPHGRSFSDQWRALSEEAPRWFRSVVIIVVVYAFASAPVWFVISMRGQGGRTPERIDALITMAIYALAAMAIFPSGPLRDPTRAWPLPVGAAVTITLPAGDLNGLRLGQPWTRLDVLGRPDNRWPSRKGLFLYPSRGLLVETEKGHLDHFAVVMVDEEGLGLDPGRAELVLPGGSRLVLSTSTTSREVRAALGEPSKSDRDSKETVDTYRQGHLQMELEYSPDGRLKRFNLFRA